MPHDGDLLNGARVLLDRILELQALRWSSYRIAHRLNETADVVRSVARCAGRPFALTRSMVFSPVLKRRVSDGLLAAMKDSPPDGCRYIEAELDDPEARPCGAPCCFSQVKREEPKRSAWCLVHHKVVYPDENNVDVPRRVYEEER